jgi:hypothetical protein
MVLIQGASGREIGPPRRRGWVIVILAHTLRSDGDHSEVCGTNKISTLTTEDTSAHFGRPVELELDTTGEDARRSTV